MLTDKTGRTEDRPFPKEPSRVIAIGDGVFAVALTLLILDVKPPTVSQTLLASQTSSGGRGDLKERATIDQVFRASRGR